MGTTFSQAGRLEVLVASVMLTNVNAVADEYKALYVLKGDAIFSVDLANVSFAFPQDPNEKSVTVNAPNLDVEVLINDEETKKLDVYQKHEFTGKSVDGYTEYLNSMNNAYSEISEKIANYDSLDQIAREAEKQQIITLVQSVCGGGVTVHVTIGDGE